MFINLTDIEIDSVGIQYLVVEQFYGKHKLGYDLYTRYKGKRCLCRFLHLIRSFEKHGWVDNYELTNIDILWWFYSNPDRTSFDENRYHNQIFLTPNHSILNGKHRAAIAVWHQYPRVPCIIDNRYDDPKEDYSMFTEKEKDTIHEACKRMHSR
jgi:hypothetical protein